MEFIRRVAPSPPLQQGECNVSSPLSPNYADLPEDVVSQRIADVRNRLGDRVVILGHHYQRDETIKHADYRGDSYKLSKIGASLDAAEYIVFCGVHFMAESADILSAGRQKVILPNMSAGCSMADMATELDVRRCWKDLEKLGVTEGLIPITYINSAASLKAFVGEHGGAVAHRRTAPRS